jgi:prolyl-tRNA synthetase
MAKETKSAISPTRAENYPEWYQAVINAADLAENSPVRGCMVIKPWGYAIWELMQQVLDDAFKRTGHVNAYFPLLIPLSHLEKEAAHVEGFAKECAVVTHSRLEERDGKLVPTSALEEPLIIRPTSETIIGECYSRWVQSYRDLPILINQWANVMRWEMRTRLFLRTSEFLWQEGHTVHATAKEAKRETLKMLDVYENFAEQTMAMPVIRGIKTDDERFPGAEETYTIEAMMQDCKALQSGTSHFLGQNFAKASNIKFTNSNGQEEFAWTTSWGVSTRLIGALIMTHSDDDGLVLPPKLAPVQIIILPIYKNDEQKKQVLDYCNQLKVALDEQMYGQKPLRVKIDDRAMNAGERNWDAIKKGIPIRLEIGPRDIEQDAVCLGRRDLSNKKKINIEKSEFITGAIKLLDEIQKHLFDKAYLYKQNNTVEIQTRADFEKFFSGSHGGFAKCFSSQGPAILEILKPLKVTARCIPLKTLDERGKCIFTGQENAQKIIFSKAY